MEKLGGAEVKMASKRGACERREVLLLGNESCFSCSDSQQNRNTVCITYLSE